MFKVREKFCFKCHNVVDSKLPKVQIVVRRGGKDNKYYRYRRQAILDVGFLCEDCLIKLIKEIDKLIREF